MTMVEMLVQVHDNGGILVQVHVNGWNAIQLYDNGWNVSTGRFNACFSPLKRLFRSMTMNEMQVHVHVNGWNASLRPWQWLNC